MIRLGLLLLICTSSALAYAETPKQVAFEQQEQAVLSAEAKRVNRYLAGINLENLAPDELVHVSVADTGWNANAISTLTHLRKKADGEWWLFSASGYLGNYQNKKIKSDRFKVGLCAKTERQLLDSEVSDLFADLKPDWPSQPNESNTSCSHCDSDHLFIGTNFGTVEHHYDPLPILYKPFTDEQKEEMRKAAEEAEAFGETLYFTRERDRRDYAPGSIPRVITKLHALRAPSREEACTFEYGSVEQIIVRDEQIETEFKKAFMRAIETYREQTTEQ